MVATVGHIVYGVEYGHLMLQSLGLLVELPNHMLSHIAQASILASREVVDGVAHIVGGVAILLEDGLIDVERVDVDTFSGYVGIHQHSIVKYLAKLLLRYNLVAMATSECCRCHQKHYG